MKYIAANVIRRFYVNILAELKRQGVDHETIAIVRSILQDVYELPGIDIKPGERKED